MKHILSLIVPVERAIAECLPYACLGDYGRQPCEMLGDIHERCCGSGEITVEILSFPHCEPCVVQERIELIACPERFLLGGCASFGRFLFDGMQLYRLLHLLDGAFEIT